jgi:hypothetical protein
MWQGRKNILSTYALLDDFSTLLLSLDLLAKSGTPQPVVSQVADSRVILQSRQRPSM